MTKSLTWVTGKMTSPVNTVYVNWQAVNGSSSNLDILPNKRNSQLNLKFDQFSAIILTSIIGKWLGITCNLISSQQQKISTIDVLAH